MMFKELKDSGYSRGCLNLTGNLKLQLEVGFSSKLSDLDNACKGSLDTLVSFFSGWDDRQVCEIHMKKYLVPKGSEYFTMLVTKVRKNIDRRK